MTFEEWYKQKNPNLESDDLYDELKEAFEAGYDKGVEDCFKSERG
jgi:hypothetical protein